jgi:hypothetical protein
MNAMLNGVKTACPACSDTGRNKCRQSISPPDPKNCKVCGGTTRVSLEAGRKFLETDPSEIAFRKQVEADYMAKQLEKKS